MPAEKHDFWVATMFPLSRRGETNRWEMSLEWDYLISSKIMFVEGPIDVAPLVAVAENLSKVEDVPLNYSDVFLVSSRARAIFDDLGPGDIQWIPTTIRCGERTHPDPYWTMHVLRTIDCADPPSVYSIRGEKPYYVRFKVDPSKVPPEVAAFRVKHAGAGPIVRDSVRQAFRKAKINGIDFYPT